MAEGSQWRQMDAADGTEVHYRYWAAASEPHAVVQVVHGAAEHSGRYDRFARFLNQRGYAVYATDHRGHGQTRVRSGELGDAGPDAWNRFVSDEIQLSTIIHKEHPDADLVLFGHSMGSFIAQDYITRQPELIDGLVLSGTAYGPAPPQDLLDAVETAAEQDPLGDSQIWAGIFTDFNKPFSDEPGYQWLSRDEAEVQKYIDDPLSGFAFSNDLVRDFFHGMAALRDPAREQNIPEDLPILVIQGELDPVGNNLEATKALLERYKQLGLTDVEHQFYDDARHELLNETNREQVQADVLSWLNEVTR
ncbi:alpha/beta hydrolase [Marinobacter lacisalsi]|uniref:Alpha/beta hydrolase n=1 Tax=Marinobacter lacisalsi TaxID=475979 RepID=A0ABV8QCN0_9GAMM